MQLLVSVRSADEVGAALAGGADIIDAKEPDRGSLGVVDREVLGRILQQIPDDCGASVALGDMTSPAEILASLQALTLPQRASPIYLKLGFAGVRDPRAIGPIIETAVSCGAAMLASPRIVAVAYADSDRARTIPPELLPPMAQASGAAAVLLDTHGKDGHGLLEWLSSSALTGWVAVAQQAGLRTALAGSLRAADLPLVCGAHPDIVGIRGAACRGGRRGPVSEDRVRQFRLALEETVRVAERSTSLGETRDTGAISSLPTTAKSRKVNA